MLYTQQIGLEMCIPRRMRHGRSGEGGDDDDGEEDGSSHAKYIMYLSIYNSFFFPA